MTLETILISLGIGLVVLILFLAGFVILRTALYSPPQKKLPPRDFVSIDGRSVAERLGLAVQYRTIADHDSSKIDGNSFLGLHRFFKTLYPQVHDKLLLETVNDYSLLYTWEGKNPDLKPIMLISHLDVVPADEGEDGGWKYPPFSGEIAEDCVWGRGTLDIKNGVIGILEAVEYLIKHDFEPERTVYLGFGHDEEIGGKNGAAAIAALLESRGVDLACLLDEGGAVIDAFLPGVETPVGAIGISEKGYLSLKLSVSVDGGHSSMPPQETAIGILSKAIANLESTPMPAHLEVVEFLMSYLGSALPFTQRMMYANTWLFGGVLKKKLAKSNMLNASMRTTTAPTIVNAGVKDNVLPGKAEAVVNFRIMPGDDLRAVYEMVLERINDERVQVSPLEGETLEGESGWNPSPVADTESLYFTRLENLVRQAFPGSLTCPYLVLGGTDARRYAPVTANAFRFNPVRVSREDLQRMHGVDECLSIENCAKMVSFYVAYIQEIGSLTDEEDLVLDEVDRVDLAPVEADQIAVVEDDAVLSYEELEAFKTAVEAKNKAAAMDDVDREEDSGVDTDKE
ncbi:MAG: M20 family peptidase [Brevefilum sp.]|nr:M20 family peptidase [Brevefilum sp.]